MVGGVMRMAHRYIVETEFVPGKRTIVHTGNDFDRAMQVANFWDRRQNTYLTDLSEDKFLWLEKSIELAIQLIRVPTDADYLAAQYRLFHAQRILIGRALPRCSAS